MHNKPIGIIPSIRTTFFLSNLTNIQLNKINFSSSKEGIEKQIIDIFIKTTRKSGFEFLDDPIHNTQDDFDFTLSLPGGKIYMELTEFIINDSKTPYRTFNSIRTHGDLHDEFINKINKKIRKVNNRIKNIKLQKLRLLPVDLLCYTSHSDYKIDNVVVALIQNTLLSHENPFENIFLLQPITLDYAEIRVLQPYSGKIIVKETLVKLRNNKLINLL